MAIRTDQGPEFTGRAFDQWEYRHGVQLKLIAAGKPTQNAFVESFSGRFRDECLNDHWLESLNAARAVIAAWRRDYNEQRQPARSLTGLLPSSHPCIVVVVARLNRHRKSANLSTRTLLTRFWDCCGEHLRMLLGVNLRHTEARRSTASRNSSPVIACRALEEAQYRRAPFYSNPHVHSLRDQLWTRHTLKQSRQNAVDALDVDVPVQPFP